MIRSPYWLQTIQMKGLDMNANCTQCSIMILKVTKYILWYMFNHRIEKVLSTPPKWLNYGNLSGCNRLLPLLPSMLTFAKQHKTIVADGDVTKQNTRKINILTRWRLEERPVQRGGSYYFVYAEGGMRLVISWRGWKHSPGFSAQTGQTAGGIPLAHLQRVPCI